jgi:hypothetical protein
MDSKKKENHRTSMVEKVKSLLAKLLDISMSELV